MYLKTVESRQHASEIHHSHNSICLMSWQTAQNILLSRSYRLMNNAKNHAKVSHIPPIRHLFEILVHENIILNLSLWVRYGITKKPCNKYGKMLTAGYLQLH